MTTKRRKLLGFVLIAVIGGAVAYGLLKRRDEPKYQGRYLSDWLEQYSQARQRYWKERTPAEIEAEAAVQNIGTNAVPYFVKWIAKEAPAWRISLIQTIPGAITNREPLPGWLEGNALRRDRYAYFGFMILGTNAVSAIPDLEAMINNPTNSKARVRARFALAHIGPPALPVFKAVLADPNHPDRDLIIHSLARMAAFHGTNSCWPVLIESLNHEDLNVRIITTNIVERFAPGVLTNAPAK